MKRTILDLFVKVIGPIIGSGDVIGSNEMDKVYFVHLRWTFYFFRQDNNFLWRIHFMLRSNGR